MSLEIHPSEKVTVQNAESLLLVFAIISIANPLILTHIAELTSPSITDDGPELVPVSLGSLRFTLPKRRDSAKASRSHGNSVTSPEIPTTSASTKLKFSNPERNTSSTIVINNLTQYLHKSDTVLPVSNLGSRPSQSTNLGGDKSVLNQQAIRQKVREVSAKQQSLQDKEEQQDEVRSQEVLRSTSVSPYSGHGSKSSRVHTVKRAELNTQHIRELQREAEKQREIAQSRTQTSHLLAHRSDPDNIQPLERSSTVSPDVHLTKNKVAIDTPDLHSEHKASVPATSRVKSLCTIPGVPPTSLEGTRIKFTTSTVVPISNDQSQIRSPQPSSPSQHAPIKTSKCCSSMSSNANLSNQLVFLGTSYAQPQNNNGFSGQEAFHLIRDSVSAEHQQSSTPKTEFSLTNVVSRLADTTQYKSSYMQDAKSFGAGTQTQPSHRYLRSKGQPESIQFQVPSQSKNNENQSPYGQQQMLRYDKQSRSVHAQKTQTQSSLVQAQAKAIEEFGDIVPKSRPMSVNPSESQADEDPFLDTAQSSSNAILATHTYPTPAQLRATSPAFVPASLNAGLETASNEARFVQSVQEKAPLPAVKGTNRHQRLKPRVYGPDLSPTSWDQSKCPFNTSTSSTANSEPTKEDTRNRHTEALRKLSKDITNSPNQAQRLTSDAAKTSSLRDPMPYTGFSSSINKKDQLIGTLNKTIDEAKAKGDLPASNRSVLFDPVASASAAGASYSLSSTAGTSYNMTSSNLKDHRLKPEGIYPTQATHVVVFSDMLSLHRRLFVFR